MDKKDGKVGAVLVVGGGIGGVQASLDLAESGFYVYLLEKSPSIGGVMAQLDKTFPTNDCSMCILSPKLVEAGRHLNIQLITSAELEEVSGEPGRFKAKILRKPRYIDPAKCTACGLCAQSDLSELKPHDGEVWVDRVVIDEAKCIQCGECAVACRGENAEQQGMSNIASERRKAVELAPTGGDGQAIDALWQKLTLMDEKGLAEFWQKEFQKCLKCFGCRDVCPVCVCDECELQDAEWITPGKIPPDTPLFHLIRAYHVADSCINCGECEATCPAGIHLRTIQHLVWRQPPEKVFDLVPGLDAKTKERLIESAKKRPVLKRGVRK